ncbi:MAG TPA: TonB-dependent receptor, partial [Rhizomicrobium sp.]|nr:TonB-dependent receptor [Rhizomicrobium sp.]
QYVAQNANLNQLYTLCPGAALSNLIRGQMQNITPNITMANPNYPFDPVVFPNKGQGFYKNVGGNDLPNTPPFTLSLGAQYSMPISSDWAVTLRGDGYWQGNSFARIYNSTPYDQIHAYTNLNLTLILTNQDGWQAMAYMKNVFDTTAITGTFLNSDDTALTTNVFTTDPRLFGLRITKNW